MAALRANSGFENFTVGGHLTHRLQVRITSAKGRREARHVSTLGHGKTPRAERAVQRAVSLGVAPEVDAEFVARFESYVVERAG